MKKITLSMLLCLLTACSSIVDDTRGMCREFEVCITEKDSSEVCIPQTIWFECAEDNEENCQWTELGEDFKAPNDMSTGCSDCDSTQCPEEI
jgi:hypothetical protein